MHRKLFLILSLVGALSVVSSGPNPLGARAEASEDPGPIHYAGSALFTLINVPYKLATCIFGQTTSGVAYVITAGVPGNYDENETNGPELGEVGTGSCSGAWLISPEQIQADYRYTDEYGED